MKNKESKSLHLGLALSTKDMQSQYSNINTTT